MMNPSLWSIVFIIYIVKYIRYRCLSVSGIIVVDVSVVDAVRVREDKRWLMLMLLLVAVVV